jgi:hypothetical protein
VVPITRKQVAMLDKVPDGNAIGKATDRLLRKASAYGRWPTPVDDLVAAAGLVEPEHSMLSNFVLEQAPHHIRRVIRKLNGKVRAVLDRKAREIHIDPTTRTPGRVAFLKLHEVGHDIFEWQKALGFADDDAHLSPTIKKLFEWQANQGAAELFFQRDLFADMARQYAIGMAAVLDLADTVGASGHATFRRFVECHDVAVAGVVLDLYPSTPDPLTYRRHELVWSDGWEQRFGAKTWPRLLQAQPYTFVTSASQACSSGSAVGTQFVLPDLRNDPVQLNVELYSNHYSLLALIWIPRREVLRRRRIIVPASAATTSRPT